MEVDRRKGPRVAAVPRAPVSGAPPSLTPRSRAHSHAHRVGSGIHWHHTVRRHPDDGRPSRRDTRSRDGTRRASCPSILRRTVRHVVERNPTAMCWCETVKRDTLSHTGVVLFQWTIALFKEFVLSGAIVWKIGLYERIMALARWAILVVGVNTELVYLSCSSKDFPTIELLFDLELKQVRCRGVTVLLLMCCLFWFPFSQYFLSLMFNF